jgi:hypothetical protein
MSYLENYCAGGSAVTATRLNSNGDVGLNNYIEGTML